MKNYIVWGAGKIGCSFLEECERKGVKNIRVCDSNRELQNTVVYGYNIENPLDLVEVDNDIIITSDVAYNDIKKNIQEHYTHNNRIIGYRDVMIMGEKEILNIGSMRFLNGFEIEAGVYLPNEFIEKLDKTSFNKIDNYIFLKKHKRINKWAHYSEIYDHYFRKYIGTGVRVLEIGVYCGGSLQMWKNYFGNDSKIFGVDINPECKRHEENGIKVFIGSQEDRAFLNNLKDKIGKVDIIIDDGGHTMNQQIVSFDELFDMLVDDGLYLCEDCHTSYMEEYGGGLRRNNTFVEYTKKLVDGLHYQYFSDSDKGKEKPCDNIKSISYYDSVVVIEKRKRIERSISWLC
ncbi:MAG: class I SAM-dependent methyltransferase [Lachnospiraceae bacterium]|nr:class I SAM-dependent methyltransferase [Lachnospiraceae bacterium]